MEEFIDNTNTRGSKINFKGKSALLNEWLVRSRSKGKKVCSLNNIQDRANSKNNIGTIEGLTSEGYLRIRTETGDILTHISGEIIYLDD